MRERARMRVARTHPYPRIERAENSLVANVVYKGAGGAKCMDTRHHSDTTGNAMLRHTQQAGEKKSA